MRNPSYPNLWESPFNVEVEGIRYFFSTRLHMEAFLRKLKKFREDTAAQLTKRYKVFVKHDRLADMYCYVSCETRGFYIIDTVAGREYTWPGAVELNGVKLIPQQ